MPSRSATAPATLLLLVLAGLLGSACAKRSQRRARDRICAKVAKAEAALDQRHDVEALDAAVEVLDGLVVRFPRQRCAHAAAAQAHLHRAVGYPGHVPGELQEAKERGLACLRLRPTVDEAVAKAGGLMSTEAAAAVEASELACLRVTNRAWLRWLEERGTDGAAIDLEVLRALVEREGSLGPQGQDLHHLVDEGLVWSLPGLDQGADLERADRAWQAAAKLEPGLLRVPVDRARHVLGPRGEAGSWTGTLRLVEAVEIEEDDPLLMENRAAKAVAAALLQAGPPRADRPAP